MAASNPAISKHVHHVVTCVRIGCLLLICSCVKHSTVYTKPCLVEVLCGRHNLQATIYGTEHAVQVTETTPHGVILCGAGELGPITSSKVLELWQHSECNIHGNFA